MNDGALTCQEMVELVTDYLDGAMAPALRARFEAHLAGCEGCAAYLDQLRTTIRLAGELPRLAVPDPALEALVDAFRDWRGRPLPGS